MSDIVGRLREDAAHSLIDDENYGPIMLEAADEIERLQAKHDEWIEVHEEHAGQRESLLAERDHLLRTANYEIERLRAALRYARETIIHSAAIPVDVSFIDAALSGKGES